jgi:ketosteroid isomerase-like protein
MAHSSKRRWQNVGTRVFDIDPRAGDNLAMKDEPQPTIPSFPPFAAVREAWPDAVRAGDVERLAELVTDDVVVVHGNGRCAHGRDELKADFLKAFDAFSIEQKVSSTEVIVRGQWFFEISQVDNWLTPCCGGQSTNVQFHGCWAQTPIGWAMEGRTCAWDTA